MIYVLYHGYCDDGFGAAWAAWKALRDTATYRPVEHGQPVPALPGASKVYLLDFAYGRAETLALRDRVGFLLVLDHHATAMRDLDTLDCAHLDEKKSGAMLAWDYFHHDVAAPRLLEYIQDRDLGRKALPHADAFSAWLRSHPHDFHAWRELAFTAETFFDQVVVPEGRAIARYRQQTAEVHAAQARWASFPGDWIVPVAAAPVNLRSEVAQQLLEIHPEAAFAGSYWERQDGQRVWTLISRGEVDVEAIARRLGGGGHVRAAGFRTSVPDGPNCGVPLVGLDG